MKTLIPLLFLSVATLPFAWFSANPPETEQVPVETVYHGEKIVDEYLWLEDQTQPEVQQWIATQNQHSQSYLNDLPDFAAISQRLGEVYESYGTALTSPVFRGGKLFAMNSSSENLVCLKSIDDSSEPEVIVDASELPAEELVNIDWFEPSPDGRYVAVCISVDGTYRGDVHIYDLNDGIKKVEVLAQVSAETAGGDLAWTPDSSGFYYTRYPHPGERSAEDMFCYVQVWHHRLGSPPESDRYEFGRDLPRIAVISLESHDASGQMLITVQEGDGGRAAHFLRTSDGEYRQFSTLEDDILEAEFAADDSLFLLTIQDAPLGRILRMSAKTLSMADATLVVRQSEHPIVSMLATESRLFVQYQLGGPSEIRVFDHAGHPVASPKQKPMSTVDGMSPLPGDRILFTTVSYTEPLQTDLFDSQTETTRRVPVFSEVSKPLRNVEVRREWATSKDGTRIPVNILYSAKVPKGQPAPCVIHGYGGYQESMTPDFDPSIQLLLDSGCHYAVVCIRGGYEFGQVWYEQGRLQQKQNVFDDFAAACQHLISAGYTTSEKLGMIGYSNGGLLMGAMLTQHPKLFRTAVSLFGVYDMLRWESSTNGRFNVTEFGTVKDPLLYRALRDYSPYHNVRSDVTYPSVLFITSANDPLVDPLQSRKMTARLQAVTRSSGPVLLVTGGKTGHFPVHELETAAYSFLLDQLGVRIGAGD